MASNNLKITKITRAEFLFIDYDKGATAKEIAAIKKHFVDLGWKEDSREEIEAFGLGYEDGILYFSAHNEKNISKETS